MTAVTIKNFKDKDLSKLTDDEIKELEEEERKERNKKLDEDELKRNPKKKDEEIEDDEELEEEEEDEGNEGEEEEEPDLVKENEKLKKDLEESNKKFVASQQEAMVLTRQIEELSIKEVPHVEVNDDHMKKIYGDDWETMTTHERIMATKLEKQEQRQIEDDAKREIEKKKEELGQKWVDKVNEFIDTQLVTLNPDLKGKEEEFRKFATKPTRRGLSFEDLVLIFKANNPDKVTTTKRSLFHAPGGPGKKVTPDKMSVEDIRRLRITNPRKYNEMVVAGKIKIDM